jgi:hypothetical protein
VVEVKGYTRYFLCCAIHFTVRIHSSKTGFAATAGLSCGSAYW